MPITSFAANTAPSEPSPLQSHYCKNFAVFGGRHKTHRNGWLFASRLAPRLQGLPSFESKAKKRIGAEPFPAITATLAK